MTEGPAPAPGRPAPVPAGPVPADLDLDAWAPWSPAELATRLAGVDVPWWVCGGWALDLFRGERTRDHEDIEFAVCRADFPAVRDALLADGAHEQFSAGSGQLFPLAPDAVPPAGYDQVWTREKASGVFRTDTFLDPGSRQEWVCKRDHRLRLPLDAAIGVTAEGIPYQRPEVVLLMKARHRRDKDDGDLARTLPLLSVGARDWLLDALAQIHPGHQWIATVRAAG